MRYFQYSQSTQSYVVADQDITSECDVSATSGSVSYFFRSNDYFIGTLINGQYDQMIQSQFPSEPHPKGPTISCLGMPLS